jgi:hypothetical protein
VQDFETALAGDGLVDAGVFADDDSRTVIGADARAGNLADRDRIRMTLVIVETSGATFLRRPQDQQSAREVSR